ncbi:histidine kinase N-terminal 7TM domain-containing protein [Halorientalis salina]|uniref:histidine kinase N-terminal 7TM domain-containing protein n=1 Tax=Halorientalis salina TaxID=2932266 RepID=UPI0010ABCAC4|nr:histidine kinase N-terminal 7TM domain-containing protein [Halorientalis salina]
MVGTADVAGVGLASVAIPALVLVAVALRHRGKPGVRGFVVAVTGVGCWSLASGLRVLVRDPGLAYGSAVGQLVAANVTILGWALLAVEFVRGRRIRLFSTRVAAVLVVPACTVVLAVTNRWHHLVYAASTHVTQGGLQLGFGPWYPVHALYLLSCSAGAAGLLVREVPGSSRVHRQQVVLLLVAWAIATLGAFDFVFRQFGPWPFPAYVDVTPVGFLLASGVWGLALFRYGLFDLVPIARRTAVETMPDAVLTVDGDDRIVDANPAAQSLLECDPVQQSVSTVFEDYPGLLAQYRSDGDGTTDIEVLDDGAVKHLAATTTPITDRGAPTGTLIVLRDVTALKSREQELDLHRQVHNRIVRHNIRNELTVIRGSAEEIHRRSDDRRAEFAETILDRCDELAATSEKARHIMRLIEDDCALVTMDARALVEDIEAEMRDRYPDATIETTGDDEAWVDAHEDLSVAVRNLLENAVVHNDGPAEVAVSVERTDGTVEVAVADDGPGIPDYEVTVLDRLSETALEHSSGAGLWLVNWVAMRSNGALGFTVTDRGTTATLTLQAAAVKRESAES